MSVLREQLENLQELRVHSLVPRHPVGVVLVGSHVSDAHLAPELETMAAILRTSASRVSCRSSSLSATVSARALSLSARSTISRTPTSARPSSFARSLAEQQQQQQLAPRAAWLHVSAVRGKSDAAKWQDQSAPIEYDELKPLTRNPTDVRLTRACPQLAGLIKTRS